MLLRRGILWMAIAISAICAIEAHAQTKTKQHRYIYQQIDLEEMVRRFISKTPEPGSIEGIYSVSCIIMKSNRSWITGHQRDRAINRKDNYAKVAILKDWPGSDTEYIELSLNAKNSPQYPIVSTITSLSDGRGFLFRHLEPDNNHMTFTFTLDEYPDILQGAHTIQRGKATIVYKLSYLKTFPKAGESMSGISGK